jgi:aspartate carbamoyltransferase regulatory subunit
MALIVKLLEWQKSAEKHFDHGGKAMDGCKCPNPVCISNLEPVRARFEESQIEPGVVRCVYCESKAN